MHRRSHFEDASDFIRRVQSLTAHLTAHEHESPWPSAERWPDPEEWAEGLAKWRQTQGEKIGYLCGLGPMDRARLKKIAARRGLTEVLHLARKLATKGSG